MKRVEALYAPHRGSVGAARVLLYPGVALHEAGGHDAHQLLAHHVDDRAVMCRDEVVVAARDLHVAERPCRVLAPPRNVPCRHKAQE